MKVLFLSQDANQVEELVLVLTLRWEGLTPQVVSYGKLGLEVIENERPELVIIAGDLPDMSVHSTIREVRRFSEVPIMVLVHQSDDGEMDLVKALESGADDYIRLPCNLMEVMARAVAVLRRPRRLRDGNEQSPIKCGDLLINPATFQASLGSDELSLTALEFKLLYLLASNRHVTVATDYIQRVVWPDDSDAGPSVKTYIKRLRQKLGDDAKNPVWIKTVNGVGYRFCGPISSEVQSQELQPYQAAPSGLAGKRKNS